MSGENTDKVPTTTADAPTVTALPSKLKATANEFVPGVMKAPVAQPPAQHIAPIPYQPGYSYPPQVVPVMVHPNNQMYYANNPNIPYGQPTTNYGYGNQYGYVNQQYAPVDMGVQYVNQQNRNPRHKKTNYNKYNNSYQYNNNQQAANYDPNVTYDPYSNTGAYYPQTTNNAAIDNTTYGNENGIINEDTSSTTVATTTTTSTESYDVNQSQPITVEDTTVTTDNSHSDVNTVTTEIQNLTFTNTDYDEVLNTANHEPVKDTTHKDTTHSTDTTTPPPTPPAVNVVNGESIAVTKKPDMNTSSSSSSHIESTPAVETTVTTIQNTTHMPETTVIMETESMKEKKEAMDHFDENSIPIVLDSSSIPSLTPPPGITGSTSTPDLTPTTPKRPNTARDEGWRQGAANKTPTSPSSVRERITPKSYSESNITQNNDRGWKRGENIPLPIAQAAILAHDDGVTRYDRISLLNIFKRPTEVPDELKKNYPPHYLTIRLPNLPKGMKPPPEFEDIAALEEDKKLLKQAENPFKFDPNRLNTDDPEAILRKANLILNKLSVTNFDKLSDEFMALGLGQTDEMLQKGIDLLVLKAQMEEHFCFMYADLCRKMTDSWSSEEDQKINPETDDQPGGDGKAEMSLGGKFRFLLLDRCRQEFEVDRTKQLAEIQNNAELNADEKLEKEIIAKKRFTGHMRFIGEIYMKDMVKPKIMKLCLDTLMEDGSEEALVCLNKLLRTIGAKLEHYDTMKRKSTINNTMNRVNDLSNDKNLSSRVRFMLKDLMDMYNKGWEARREEIKATKISSTKDESNNPGSSGKGGKPNSPRTSGSQDARNSSSSTTSSKPAVPAPAPVDEWTTVATSKKSSKMTDSKSSSSSNMGKSTSSNDLSSRGSGGSFAALSKNTNKDMNNNNNRRTSQTSGKLPSRDSFSKLNDNRSPKGGSSNNNSNNKDYKANSSNNNNNNTNQKNTTTASSPTGMNTINKSGTNDTLERQDSNESILSVTHDDSVVDYSEPLASHILNSMSVTLEEYFVNELADEVIQDIKEKVPLKRLGDIVNYLFRKVLEKKENERIKYNKFLKVLVDANLLTTEEIIRAVLLILHDYDEMIEDYPLIGTYVANMTAQLIASKVLTLHFLTTIPEENNFSMTSHAHDLLGKILSTLSTKYPVDGVVSLAESTYLSAGGSTLLQKLPPPIDNKSIEEIKAELAEKYQLAFLSS